MKAKDPATCNTSGLGPNSVRSLFGRGALRRRVLCQNVDTAHRLINFASHASVGPVQPSDPVH